METNVSINQLFASDSPMNLETCIKAAEKDAARFMSKAGFIKIKHEAGCQNSSLESTTDGALGAARVYTKNLGQKDRSAKVAFIGEHISEAIHTLRTFLYSKK